MRKLFACSVTIFLVLLSSNTPSYSAIKAGSICKKAGATLILADKKFLCVKVQKKLMWKELPARKLQKPFPGTSPEPSKPNEISSTSAPIARKYPAWQMPLTTQEISRAAKLNFKLWLTEQSNGPENIVISVNPEIDAKNVNYLTTVMKIASKSLLQNEKQVSRMYVSVGDEWAIQQFKKDFPNLISWSGDHVCYKPNPFAGCAWPNMGIMFFISENGSNWINQNPGVLQAGAHEYFHLVQDVLLRNTNDINTGLLASKIPAWFFEGSAQFVGTAFANESGLIKWEDLRNLDIDAYKTGRGTNEPLESFQVNALDRPQPEAQSHRPYGIGMLACELIVASTGMQQMMDIFSQLGKGLTFEEAFLKSAGMKLSDFYALFDSMRVEIGFYPVKKN